MIIEKNINERRATMSRYITEFLSLKCTPDILATVGHLGNKPEKEISEAWAIIRKLRKIVLRHPDKFQIVDLCSGNALVPVTAVHLLPIVKAYAIDKLPRDRNWHLARNFIYIKEDIYNIKTSLFNKPTILTAVHSCRNLAEQTIKIYNENDQIKHLILMPCCQGKLDNPILRFIKNEMNTDVAWALKLALQCGEGVRITKDKFVLSPKNYIISASKKVVEEPIETIEEPTFGVHKRIGESSGGVTL